MIRFNAVSEFVHELECNPPRDDLVRITKRFTDSRISPQVKHVAVVATYRQRSDGDIVKLEKQCGTYWARADEKADEVASKVIEEVQTVCTAMAYDTRPGVIEDD